MSDIDGGANMKIRHTLKEKLVQDNLKIEAISKENGEKNILICRNLNEAKELYGKRYKDFKPIGWK